MVENGENEHKLYAERHLDAANGDVTYEGYRERAIGKALVEAVLYVGDELRALRQSAVVAGARF